MRTGVRYGYRYGEVYTTAGGLEGVAVWLRPGETDLALWKMLATGVLSVPLQFGSAGLRRFGKVVGYIDQLHHRDAPGPHWYLWILGVAPGRQGTGVGGRLIQPGLARADAAGLPCYLLTMTERNLIFYARHGFRVATAGQLPDGGPRVWGMLRDPRG